MKDPITALRKIRIPNDDKSLNPGAEYRQIFLSGSRIYTKVWIREENSTNISIRIQNLHKGFDPRAKYGQMSRSESRLYTKVWIREQNMDKCFDPDGSRIYTYPGS